MPDVNHCTYTPWRKFVCTVIHVQICAEDFFTTFYNIFHESLQTMSFRTRTLVLHPAPPHNAVFSLSFIHSIFTVSSDRCSFFIGLYSLYASCNVNTIERKLLFFQRKVQFLFYLYFKRWKYVFLDTPLSELQEMSITALQNISITLCRSCNVVVTSLYKNSPDVNNCKQDSQNKS